MLKKTILVLLFAAAAILAVYFYSSAKKDISKLPPPETASGDASVYMPEGEGKQKMDANVRVSGPVWVSPEDKQRK